MILGLIKKKQNSFVVNSYYLYLTHLADYLLAFFFLPFIAKAIGAVEFGKISFIQTFGVLIIILIEFGSPLAATKTISRIKDDKVKLKSYVNEVSSFRFYLLPYAILLSTISFSFIPIFSQNIDYLLVVVVGAIFQGYIPSWYFLGIEKMKKVAYSRIAFRLLGFILILFFVRSPDDSLLVLGSFTFSSILICIYLHFHMIKQVGPIKFFPSKRSKRFFKKTFSSFLIILIPVIYQNISMVLLSFFINPLQLGVLYGASRIHRAFNSLFSPLSQAFFPFISSVSKNEVSYKNSLILKYFFFILFIGLIFFNINYFFAEKIVYLLLGGEFVESSNLLKYFSIVFPLTAISNALGRQWLVVRNQDRLFSIIQFIASISSLIFLFYLISNFKIYAIPYSLILYEITTIILIIIFLILKNEN